MLHNLSEEFFASKTIQKKSIYLVQFLFGGVEIKLALNT